MKIKYRHYHSHRLAVMATCTYNDVEEKFFFCVHSKELWASWKGSFSTNYWINEWKSFLLFEEFHLESPLSMPQRVASLAPEEVGISVLIND